MRDNLGRFTKHSIPHNKGKKGWVNSRSYTNGHKQTNSGRTHWISKMVQDIDFQIKRVTALKKNTSHHNWRGKDASYAAKHIWINNHYGRPSFCEICKLTRKEKYEWANISGLYKRNISDWKRLCQECHKKFDLSRKGAKEVMSI